MNEVMDKLVIGVDFGTDSVRAVVIDAGDGAELGQAVHSYRRWQQGLYCDPSANQYRQHPLDYLEGLETSIREALAHLPDQAGEQVVGIAIDTTGSTPVAVDQAGTPLSLLPEFSENPHAMFILWKDHTAIAEAEEINRLCRSWSIDYSKFSGGVYSSEWFWAKILRALRVDPQLRDAAHSWVEHCDWIPYVLTGGTQISEMKRSRCSAGHKALWHPDFGGLPPNDFFVALDPLLGGLVDRLYQQTYTSNQSAGTLCEEWAKKLGLSQKVVVAVGAFDAHMGAVGGQIQPYYLSKVMGTSTCDMLTAPIEDIGDRLIKGICGQVDGSIIPGMMGLEAGQSAFGDVYAWFERLLNWPLKNLLEGSGLPADQQQALIDHWQKALIPTLSNQAAQISPGESATLALDWLNGRRTPDANQALKGAILNLDLGSDAPRIFRALVEATCFGARKIVERFTQEGIPIKGIIGLGGVSQKSPFVMQTMANVLNLPIKIARSDQTCALGAAMFAATAAGVHGDVSEAMEAMGAGFNREYSPQAEWVAVYDSLYEKYQRFGQLIEDETTS